jgi:hypothetical protein
MIGSDLQSGGSSGSLRLGNQYVLAGVDILFQFGKPIFDALDFVRLRSQDVAVFLFELKRRSTARAPLSQAIGSKLTENQSP